ncbi:molybdenum cofactor guanylyltransferase, partial [Bdellovibrionota bacterium FG-1]
RSTRMGQDKAQLMWGAERLLDRQIRVLAEALQCGRDSIWVSGSVVGYRFIEDQNPGLGPIEGLRSVVHGLSALGVLFDRLLLLPVDMPGVSVELLVRLCEEAGDSEDADLASFMGFELPLLVSRSATVIEAIERLNQPEVESRHRSFRELKKQVSAKEMDVDPDEMSCFANINTPMDMVKSAHRLRSNKDVV